MKIQVTQQHINDGWRGSCSGDPIAFALRDAGFERPWVSPDHIAWRKDHKDYSVDTPQAVLAFIQLYDNNHEVFPFEFWLEV